MPSLEELKSLSSLTRYQLYYRRNREKILARKKEYNARPEVVARRKEYKKLYRQRIAARKAAETVAE